MLKINLLNLRLQVKLLNHCYFIVLSKICHKTKFVVNMKHELLICKNTKFTRIEKSKKLFEVLKQKIGNFIWTKNIKT